MNREKFIEIMLDEDIKVSWEGCNVFLGLEIIRKYLPKSGIEGASHDIVYSVDIDEIIEAGITEEDVRKLRSLNWLTEDEYLACFV
jgi:hypothetical protein